MSKKYKFVEKEDSDFYGVEFLEGKYKGVIVVYGTVKVEDSGEDGILSFTYNIQDSAEFDHDKLNESEEFKNYIGDMLRDIIIDSIGNGGQIGSKSSD